MTIVLPADYHAQQALEENRVICITEEQALARDIRALRIGILNVMPEAQTYEFSLLNPLGRSILQIVPVWIKLRSHTYQSTAKGHLERLYVYFEDALAEGGLDGLILTGAPVEHMSFEDVRYWNEVTEILKISRKTIPSTLGICWGGMALAYVMGIEKTYYPQKIFGIFETESLDAKHPITGSLDDLFWLPHSRFAGYANETLERAARDGIIHLLAKTVHGDYPIFESADHRFLINLGHFEYKSSRFKEEYERDQSRMDVSLPKNFDLGKPVNRWRGQRNEFFHQWLRYCHEETHHQRSKYY